MALTPSEIEQKTFSTALRGYDLNEVDDFLDEIVTTIKELTEQLEEARSARPVSFEPAPVAAPTPTAVPDESAVGRALVAAQEAADRILEEASTEAERIRGEAKAEAETWSQERDAKKAEADREMQDLEMRVANVRRELAVLATAVADRLDEMDAAIQGGMEASTDDGARGEENIEDDFDDETVDLEEVEGALHDADTGEGDVVEGAVSVELEESEETSSG